MGTAGAEKEACRPVSIMGVAFALVLPGLVILSNPSVGATSLTSPLIFRNGQVTVFINTDNVLRIGIVDEFINTLSAYDTLLTYDSDLNLVPWLAHRYEDLGRIGANYGNTFRFYLVRDACFVDPTATDRQAFCNAHPLTSRDVVFTYNLLMDLRRTLNPSPSFDAYVERVSEARAVDSHTVDITFTQPYAPWASTFGAIPILPEFQWAPIHATQDVVTWDPPVIIGSGPLLSIRADSYLLELQRNPYGLNGRWWGTNAYGLEIRPDVVQHVAYGSQANVTKALRAGEVDLDLDPGTQQYFSLSGATVGGLEIKRVLISGLGFQYLAPDINIADAAVRATSRRYLLGHANPALRLQEVRTAIHMSINRRQLVDEALMGLAVVGETLIPGGNPWHYDVPSSEEVPFDPASARALLNSRGWVYNATYALLNSGALRNEPTATPLAADLNFDGAIDTSFYGGEILKFRFATFDTGDWVTMYRLIQGWAALSGIRLMDGTNGECGMEAGCGLLSPTEMNSLWTSLDYDLWIWDRVLGSNTDPSDILWLETTMAIGAIQGDNGYANPYYDAQYNRTLQVLEPNCRRYGGAFCPPEFQSVTFRGTGNTLYIDDRGTDSPTFLPYARGETYARAYLGTDGMQRMIYDFASYIIAAEGAVPYAFHELNWVGFGDWTLHQGLSPEITLYWLYFQISPRTQKAPWVSALTPFMAFSGSTVTLGAMAVDPEGTLLTYRWDLDEARDTDGDGVTGNDADIVTQEPIVTITVPALGPTDPNVVIYPISVRITDGTWTERGSSALRVVKLGYATPMVLGLSFTPEDPWIGPKEDPLTFFTSYFSPSGGPASFRWTFGDGTSLVTSTPLARHTYHTTNSFMVNVRATDSSSGLVASGARTLKVGINGGPFIADLPPRQVAEGRSVEFRALASDGNLRDRVTYTWEFGNLATASGPLVQYVFPLGSSSGSPYQYKLTVADGVNPPVTKVGVLFIIPGGVPNQGPTIVPGSLKCFVGEVECGDTFVYEHQTIRVQFQASDPEGNPMAARYTVGRDVSIDGGTSPPTVPNQIVTFTQDMVVPTSGGTLRITAYVKDLPLSDQLAYETSTYITLSVRSNSPPTLLAPGLAGVTVNFGEPAAYTFTPYDPNDATLSYVIHFGDGTSEAGTAASGQTLTTAKVYASAGRMPVTLTLRDPKGASYSATAVTQVRGTLGSFPFPFADRGVVSGGGLVLGLSQPKIYGQVQLAGAASTIDVVGAVPIGGIVGARTFQGTLSGLLDTEAVTPDGSRLVPAGHLMGVGGRGTNLFTRLVNPTLPVRQAQPTDGTGVGIYASESGRNYRRTSYPDGSIDDYAFFSIRYDLPGDRYFLVAAGLSGYATRTIAQLIALDDRGQLREGRVLTGTGIVVKLHDNNNDGTFETYQALDGTGNAVIMPSPATIPQPESVAHRFAIGLSVAHGLAGPASTIDAAGSVPLATAMARQSTGRRMIWASLDTEIAEAGTLLNTADNLVSIGGRGVNLVTRYYNASMPIRQAGPYDGSGRGIYSEATGTNFLITNVLNPDGSLDYVIEYALDSFLVDVTNNGRTVEVVAGLSGFATREACRVLAAGTVVRGSSRAILIGFIDHGGDHVYEEAGVADTFV